MFRIKLRPSVILFALYFILKPFYFLKSSVQLADMLLIILFFFLLVVFISQGNKITLKSNVYTAVLLMFLFVIWSFVVNSFLTMSYGVPIYKGTVYLVYNLIAIITVILYFEVHTRETLNHALLFVKISITIQFFLSFFISEGGSREVIFFNNPNQLGYYGLIVLTFLMIFDKNKKTWIYIYMCIYLVLISNSSAAIFGILVILLINFLLSKINITLKILTSLLFLIIGLFTPSIISTLEKIPLFSRVISRLLTKESEDNLLDGRGYGRLFELDFNFLWGLGEGGYERFSYLTGSELHSTIIGIIVSYGLVGLFLFLFVLKSFNVFSFRKSNFLNMYFIGIFVYWLTHQGIRNTMFWILLVLFLFYTERFYKKGEQDDEKSISNRCSGIYRIQSFQKTIRK